MNDRWPLFKAIIEDDNNTLKEKLIPAYVRMVDTFRDKLWLAEPRTRDHFVSLIEFVEIWERHLRGALPVEVIEAIGHGEEKLTPFYEHLQMEHDRIRDAIARGG